MPLVTTPEKRKGVGRGFRLQLPKTPPDPFFATDLNDGKRDGNHIKGIILIAGGRP